MFLRFINCSPNVKDRYESVVTVLVRKTSKCSQKFAGCAKKKDPKKTHPLLLQIVLARTGDSQRHAPIEKPQKITKGTIKTGSDNGEQQAKRPAA